ncbi:MAG: histidinol-phosphatase HisJ family protein [Oscillospiraceae bacterium]|nr:histidinol-phosphatase HisJ family protein [Oscillospiraceae bacterium]
MGDYHTHSLFSPDGRDSVLEIARAARGAGMEEVAITDHCDIIPPGGEGFPPLDGDGYFRAVRDAQEKLDGIRLVYGLELGEGTHNPETARRIAGDYPFDFIIGSYHALKDSRDFYCLEYPSAADCHALIDTYLDELSELCSFGGFDVLGHLTYPLRYMSANPELAGKISFISHTEKVRAVFDKLIESGRGIELNVSGLFRKNALAMPDLPLLKLYRGAGGEIVTVGSDAHGAKSAGRGIREGYEMLKQAGFRFVAAYQERRPRFEKI